MGPLMINMAFMPLYMWEMWDVTPVTDEHTNTRTVESRAVFSLNWIRNKVVSSSLYLRWSPWQRDSQDGIRGRILIKPTSSHVPPLLIYFLTFIIFCDTVNMVLVTPKSTINLNKHSPRVHLQFGTVTWTFACEMPKILYNVNTWQFPQKWMFH